MTARARRAGAAALLVLAGSAGISACGTGTEAHPVKLNRRGVPGDLLAGPTTTLPPTTAPTRKHAFIVYFVRPDGVVPVVRTSSTLPTTQIVGTALLAGPTQEEAQVDMRSAIPPRAVARITPASRGLVTVDLEPAFAQVSLAEQKIALTQLVFSLTLLHGVSQVRFLMQGAPVSVPRGNGTSTNKPVRRSDYVTKK